MELRDLFYDEHAALKITRRDRPHWMQEGKAQFVTWRLADSLPKVMLKELERDRRTWLRLYGGKDLLTLGEREQREYHRLFHERVERWLDAGAGSCVLQRPGPRQVVVDALHFFDGKRYRLGTFAVAGNHVHVLVVPFAGMELSGIMHSWKSYTAKSINKLLGRTGTLWRAESFDHIVRSEAYLVKFERYIRAHEEQGAYVEERSLALEFPPA